jgi:acyl dehydratase
MTVENEPPLMLGKQVQRIEIGTIDALAVQRYATAIGDYNRVYFDEAAAREAGYRTLVAPLNYLTSVRGWGSGPPEGQLQADGTEVEDLPEEMMGATMMGGGHELAFFMPVYVGDTVTATRSQVELYKKTSRTGELTFGVWEIVYRNQNDELLVTCRETIIAARKVP